MWGIPASARTSKVSSNTGDSLGQACACNAVAVVIGQHSQVVMDVGGEAGEGTHAAPRTMQPTLRKVCAVLCHPTSHHSTCSIQPSQLEQHSCSTTQLDAPAGQYLLKLFRRLMPRPTWHPMRGVQQALCKWQY
jgi:hypothetical protein